MEYAVLFASCTYLLRLLTLSGAIAAAVLGSILWIADPRWAVPIVLFFVTAALLSVIATRKGSARNAAQVLANGGPAGIFALANILNPHEALTLGMIASIAAATADSWATEVGQEWGLRPRRITNLRPERTGVHGAVTLAGLVASLVGALLIAFSAQLFQRTDAIMTLAAFGFCGGLLDSVLGDTLQRSVRWMTNDLVNVLSVSAAGVAGYLAA